MQSLEDAARRRTRFRFCLCDKGYLLENEQLTEPNHNRSNYVCMSQRLGRLLGVLGLIESANIIEFTTYLYYYVVYALDPFHIQKDI